jgi:hypothetical protein
MHAGFDALMEQKLFPLMSLHNTYIHVPSDRMSDYAYGYATGRVFTSIKDFAMISRRDYLALCMAIGAGSVLAPNHLWANEKKQGLITRPIPSLGERLPVIGLGSAATLSSAASAQDVDALQQVLHAFVQEGGSVFDTAPVMALRK